MTRGKQALLWAGALALVSLGLLPLLGTPPIGDDPITIAEGVGRLWGSGSVLSSLWEATSAALVGSHVLPIGGLTTALEILAFDGLVSLGVAPTIAWGLLRGLQIILTLLVFSWTLSHLLFRRDSDNGFNRSTAVLTYFVLTSGWFFALMQIHAPFSQDPILAYAVSSWFALCLAFLYLGLIATYLNRPQGGQRYLALAAAVGLLGIFTYEPVAIAVGVSVVMAAFWFWSPAERKCTRDRVSAVVVTAVALLLVFAAAQIWRLSEPAEYAGTAPGFLKMILPTWMNSILGFAPLTTLGLVPEAESRGTLALAYAVLASLLILIGFWLGRSLGRPLGWVALQAVLVMLIFTGLTVALYASSRKYQLEIGSDVGKTYLFYALGLTVVAGCLAVLCHMVAGRRVLEVLLVICATALAFSQWTLNAKALAAVEQEWSWTRPLINSLTRQGTAVERCRLLLDLRAREMPPFFRNGVEDGLERAYRGRYAQSFCADKVSP